ncbi:hypothetical protein Tco_0088793 [Tanacetum coccineum]
MKGYHGTSLDDALYKVVKRTHEEFNKDFFDLNSYKDVIDESVQTHVMNEVQKQLPTTVSDFVTPVIQSIVYETLEKNPRIIAQTSSQSQTSYEIPTNLKTTLSRAVYPIDGSFAALLKGKSPATSSKSVKSAKEHVEEPIFVQGSNDDNEAIYDVFDNTEVPIQSRKRGLGKSKEQPTAELFPRMTGSKKFRGDPSPDPENDMFDKKQLMKIDILTPRTSVGRFIIFSKELAKAMWSRLHNGRILRILSVISIKVDEWYGYGYLEEIVVKRADGKFYTFKEGDFKRLHLYDIEEMLLLIVQNKLNNLDGKLVGYLETRKRFMRTKELHKFGDGTLIFVRDELNQMLGNLQLGYNKTMKRRMWKKLDQQRTSIMIRDINKKLLERRILRSLEKFVGGREYGDDVRLLQRTI